MIFVTVGTHEQPFDRLIECVDQLKCKGIIEDEVIIQTGFSSYVPKFCKWNKMLPYDQMKKNIADAKIIITHGGPASFIVPLQMGKTPIVVPRQAGLGEHVNNHQVDFVQAVVERMGAIIPVFNIEDLSNIIKNYDFLVADLKDSLGSNNRNFNQSLDQIVQGLFNRK